MPERWPDVAGRINSGVHVLPVRVYFEDTDFSGVVYHANYLEFCERGRSDCLRLLGVHHHRLGDCALVVRHMVCEFLRPGRIDDLLEVHTYFARLSGARIHLQQKIFCGEAVLFEAEVIVAFVDGSGRPRRLPLEIVQSLSLLAVNYDAESQRRSPRNRG